MKIGIKNDWQLYGSGLNSCIILSGQFFTSNYNWNASKTTQIVGFFIIIFHSYQINSMRSNQHSLGLILWAKIWGKN
jgi:hypothetical protein